MPKLPNNPVLERLRDLEPPLHRLETDALWHRIYHRAGAHASQWNRLRTFGPVDSRFDHHLRDAKGQPCDQERGIVYLAGDAPTSIAEVFQANREVDTLDRHPWLVSFRLANPLHLLDLTDAFAVRAGGSIKMMTGPRSQSQNWSRGFYDAYDHIDGLYYLSSMTNRPVVALYERALSQQVFPDEPLFHRSLADPLMLIPIQEACKDIGYHLSPKTVR